MTNVTITREVGAIAGSSYAAQDFIGLEFTGTSSDGLVYNYEIGLSGQTNTTDVNDSTPAPADMTPPTALSLVRSNPAALFTNADTVVWQLTFDEAVQNVDAGDFAVFGTSANLVVTGSGATYNLTLSGGDLSSVTGGLSIVFSSPTIQDLAGNAFGGADPATNENSYLLDNAQDTLVLTTPSASVSGPFDVTGVFAANGPATAPNAANPGLAVLSNVQITNGTRTGGSSFSGNTMTFEVTPSGPGEVTVSFLAGAATDGVGNPTQASNVLSVTVQDNTPPVITVPANITQSTDTGAATASVTFAPTAIDDLDASVTVTTDPVSGFDFPVGTTTVTASAMDSTGNSSSATFDVTVTDDEAPVVTVPLDITDTVTTGETSKVVNFMVSALDNVDGSIAATANPPSGTAFPVGTTTVTVTATDGATNTGTNSFTVTIKDGSAPVVTVPANIVQSTDAGENFATVSFTVSAEDETDGTLTPVVTTSPTAGLGSGSQFPLGTTTVTVSATDGATNTGTAQFTVTVEDKEAPVIRPIGAVSFEADPSGAREVGFNTIVDDNVDTGIVPVFRLDGNIISSPYDFPIGLNAITINATDTAGNAATEVTFNLTITAGVAPDVPVITTSDINANRSMTIGGTAETDSTVRVTFPDATFQEVTATGGVFSVTSAADMTGGTVSVTATDARGYTSPAATVDLFPDFVGPTVTITGAPPLVEELVPFTVTITFSEDVTGFDQGDITLTGGTITAFAGAGSIYTADITPVIGQDIAISIAADVAEDAFTNPNAASNVVTIVNATMTETEMLVTSAAQQRNKSLIRTQPRINRFLLGGQSGSFNANVTQGAGRFDFTTSSDRPVWVAGQGQWSTQGEMETSYANLAVGAHFAPTGNILLGVMAQFDNSVSDEGAARLESTGWLVGPYAVARMADQPLVFSGSYLMGQSDNSVSPLGTYTDDYSSDRVLATLGVAGEVELTRMTLIPLLDLAYASDENEAYVDGNSTPVRAIKVTTTQATLGLDFIMPIMIDNGTFDLIGGIGATSSVENNGFTDTENTRGQTELGFHYGMENGGRLTARATYDGLGQDDYEAFGAEVVYEISF